MDEDCDTCSNKYICQKFTDIAYKHNKHLPLLCSKTTLDGKEKFLKKI